MRSIRFKIAAITVAAIITTLLCVFAVSFVTLNDQTDRSAVRIMDLLAQNTARSVSNYTESVEQSVRMTANIASDTLDSVTLVECGVAGGTRSSDRTDEQKERLDKYLAGYLKKIQQSFSSVAAHTQGVESYFYCINPAISENEHGFCYARMGKSGFHKQKPIDARRLSPEKKSDIWYFTASEHGHPVWVEPYRLSDDGDKWIVTYVVPIYDSGSLIGLLGMDIPVDTLTEQVRSIRVYRTGFACLIDGAGRVIYHPEMDFGNVVDIKKFNVDEETLKKGNSGSKLIRYESMGERRQLSFYTLSNGMRLAVVAPVREINSAWIKLVLNDMLAALIIAAVFTMLILIAIGMITRPMLDLVEASRHLANEEYDIELSYKGKDEVGVLTETFVQMRDRIRTYIDDLSRRANTDGLTGLNNMRHFLEKANARWDEIRLSGGTPVMLYINIIGMKSYNLQYGFNAGNKRIIAVAEILEKHYGREWICRLNQDHFGVLTDDIGLDVDLEMLLDEGEHADKNGMMQIRIGVYVDNGDDISAHVACDRAKYGSDLHRGEYVSGIYYYTPEMQKYIDSVRYVVNNFSKALSEGWIKVYYQPIINSATGEKCDEEALSRWQDPEKGLLPPDDFVPVLERAGLIYRLDLYVLDKVLEKIRLLGEAGREIVPVSINLSRSDFESCDIVEEVRRRVDEAGVPHDMFSIEITESIIGSDFDFMKKQVDRFRSLGFPVWMDDFGSGYSSLDVLQEIHFDLIKLDMRFMHNFDNISESKLIVSKLIELADELGEDTLCEGVETESQVEFLRSKGCTKIQGYYYGRPEPFEM